MPHIENLVHTLNITPPNQTIELSSEAYPATQEKHEDTCWLCGRMLKAGYYFVCHVCGATYCYSHMPEKCLHSSRVQPPSLKVVPPKA